MTKVFGITQNSKPIPFPDLQAMKLVLDMDAKLAGNESMIAYAIKLSILKTPPMNTISQVKDMIHDNPSAMAGLLGNSLVYTIQTFK